MAQHSWVGSAPTGVFKNHALSAELIKASIAESIIMQYVSPVKSYGPHMGESVTWSRVSNLTVPTDAELEELKEVPEDDLSLSTGSLTVKELARAVTWTNKDAILSKVSIPDAAKEALQDQMSLYLDMLAMDNGFKAAKMVAIPTAETTVEFETDGTTGGHTATVASNYYLMEKVRDYLYGTLHAKPYVDGEYICLGNTLFCRGIKDSREFEEWNKYTTPDKKHKGEIGKIEGIRIIEVQNNAILDNVGTGSVLGEAVVFGANAVKLGSVITPHLVMRQATDYGRSFGCAWYGMLNCGPTWDTGNAGEANIIRITSA